MTTALIFGIVHAYNSFPGGTSWTGTTWVHTTLRTPSNTFFLCGNIKHSCMGPAFDSKEEL